MSTSVIVAVNVAKQSPHQFKSQVCRLVKESLLLCGENSGTKLKEPVSSGSATVSGVNALRALLLSIACKVLLLLVRSSFAALGGGPTSSLSAPYPVLAVRSDWPL